MFDNEKHRREFGRWVLILGLYNAEPRGAQEAVLLSILQGMYADATCNETRRALDYLCERGLVHVKKHPDGHWEGKLSRAGIDLAEHAIDCDPGIARPPRD